MNPPPNLHELVAHPPPRPLTDDERVTAELPDVAYLVERMHARGLSGWDRLTPAMILGLAATFGPAALTEAVRRCAESDAAPANPAQYLAVACTAIRGPGSGVRNVPTARGIRPPEPAP